MEQHHLHPRRLILKLTQNLTLKKITLIQSLVRTLIAKKLRKQLLIAQELYVTETNYVEVLRVIKEIFLSPAIAIRLSLQTTPEALSQIWITEEETDIIFYRIETIFLFHKKFLHKLQSRARDWEEFEKHGVSELFMENKSGFIEQYSGYVNNYNAALSTLGHKRKTCAKFSEFIIECEANPVCKYEDLESLLIAPVQRIPRYGLFFKRFTQT